jgi:hypothetical protein
VIGVGVIGIGVIGIGVIGVGVIGGGAPDRIRLLFFVMLSGAKG